MLHYCSSTGKGCPGWKRGRESPDVVLQAQLTVAANDGVGPVYFEGFIFKAFAVALVSEQLPTLLLSPSVSKEIVLFI